MAPPNPIRRNVELKARDPHPDRSLEACRALGAVDHGLIVQRDTYYDARHGRLKLREESPGRPHLIHYEREDQVQQRQSGYRIVSVVDAPAMRAVLAASLGERGVVEKHRHLLIWNDVRIHLDAVAGLGRFVELEAVAGPESDLTREYRLVDELRVHLEIDDERLCPHGYADQLLAPST